MTDSGQLEAEAEKSILALSREGWTFSLGIRNGGAAWVWRHNEMGVAMVGSQPSADRLEALVAALEALNDGLTPLC